MDQVRANIYKAWRNSSDGSRREALWLKHELTYEIEGELKDYAK